MESRWRLQYFPEACRGSCRNSSLPSIMEANFSFGRLWPRRLHHCGILGRCAVYFLVFGWRSQTNTMYLLSKPNMLTECTRIFDLTLVNPIGFHRSCISRALVPTPLPHFHKTIALYLRKAIIKTNDPRANVIVQLLLYLPNTFRETCDYCATLICGIYIL